MYAWLSLILSYAGFIALALAMPRHFEELRGGKPGQGLKPLFRLAAIAFLGLSLLAALQAWPNGVIAVSAWLGLLTVAAFALAMVMTWTRPKNRHVLPLLPVVVMAAAALTGL